MFILNNFQLKECQKVSKSSDNPIEEDEEVKELKEAAENLNTPKSTINWERVFEKWCDENSLEKNLETILPEQLDKVLERFYASVCKQDGIDYEPRLGP